MNNIREYLCREAGRITDASGGLVTSADELRANVEALRAQYLEMMGIVSLPREGERPPLNPVTTAVTEADGYTIERFCYESLPRLYVTANLYVPRGLSGPAPAVAYFCGHSDTQKVHYQTHARAWAELGYVTLIVDTIQFGEIKGHHHGCYREGWWHWYSRGYTPGGVELMNGMRALDYLCSRDEVDAGRIGVTGISGGGAMTWYLAAGDARVRAAAPVCGTGTLRSHLAERSLDGHCDCMYFINHYGWDLADLAALIAPRPLLICSADHDGIYSIASIRECKERASQYYEMLDASDAIGLIETPTPHSYHVTSTTGIFSWFARHLRGEDRAPDTFDDVDPYEVNDRPAEELRVYVDGPPRDERTSVIHDSFVPLAARPKLDSADAVKAERARVVDALKARTFRQFPDEPVELEYREEFEHTAGDATVRRFSFVTEEGWRLHGNLVIPFAVGDQKAPVLVYAHHPGRGRMQGWQFWGGCDLSWIRLEFEPRGVAETSWGEMLSWHVRRGAAVTGRTVASMRTHDILRALELARGLPQSNGVVALGGCGEVGVSALYAALLDGDVKTIALEDVPGTQDEPSNPDGTGEAVEMLGVLRFTDLPVAAGLLYPAEIVFKGNRPDEYVWTEELYARLGAPGCVTHVKSLADWHPRTN